MNITIKKLKPFYRGILTFNKYIFLRFKYIMFEAEVRVIPVLIERNSCSQEDTNVFVRIHNYRDFNG